MISPRIAVLLTGLVALSNAVSIRDVGFGELVRRLPQQKGGQQGQQGGQQLQWQHRRTMQQQQPRVMLRRQ
jgi:hypothetical protein